MVGGLLAVLFFHRVEAGEYPLPPPGERSESTLSKRGNTGEIPSIFIPPEWPRQLPPIDGSVETGADGWQFEMNLLEQESALFDAGAANTIRDEQLRISQIRGPQVLAEPAENPYDMAGQSPVTDPLNRYPVFPTPGFAGASSVLPSEQQESSHFVPMEDRWRIGSPAWDRYGRGHPRLDDYPYALGNAFNPYTQNFLKEDFPLIGQHTFFDMKGISRTITNFRQVPTPNTPFESTPTPGQEPFFGNPNGFLLLQYYALATRRSSPTTGGSRSPRSSTRTTSRFTSMA